MRRLSFRLIMFLITLTFGLFLFYNQTGSNYFVSANLDFRMAALISVGLLSFLIDQIIEDDLNQWNKKKYEEEEELQDLVRNRKNCNYCGNPDLSKQVSGIMNRYCSKRCLFTAQRWTYFIAGTILYVLSWTNLSGLIIPALPLMLFGLWGIMNDLPKYRYRYVISDQYQNSSTIQTPVIERPERQLRYISELNREVRICCFQTARLKEDYCGCGRAIDEELKTYVSRKLPSNAQ